MGLVFKIPAGIVFVAAGFWGFFASLAVVIEHLGFLGGVIAFMFFPVTLAFAPWYEVIANSNWFLVMLVYGGGLSAAALFAIGAAIDGD